MSSFPQRPQWHEDRAPDTTLVQKAEAREDLLHRWEVRAAQWRAHALAEAAFGPGVQSSLTGVRVHGALRGLLRLDVPFDNLPTHSGRQDRFMAAVREDPVLRRVPLLFVVGPRQP